MLKFTKKTDYNESEKVECYEDSCCRDYMDEEVRDLCDAMNSLPGIKTIGSCCGHSSSPLHISFYVTDSKEGLFFLTRCMDKRYWKYGYLWKINLSIGDAYENGHLPIHYELTSGVIVGGDAYEQAKNLIENMEQHLNHDGFIDGFDINIENFKL